MSFGMRPFGSVPFAAPSQPLLPITQAISSGAETSAAQGIIAAFMVGVGVAAEADVTLSFGLASRLSSASETDAGAPLGLWFGMSATDESDAALALATSFGIAATAEIDTAFSFGAGNAQIVPITVSAEADLAIAAGISFGIGASGESDAATVLARTFLRSVGIGVEADSPFAITGHERRAFATGLEISAAIALARLHALGIAPAGETDGTFPASQAMGISWAGETSLALPVEPISAIFRDIGMAAEAGYAVILIATDSASILASVEADQSIALSSVFRYGIATTLETDAALLLGIKSFRRGFSVIDYRDLTASGTRDMTVISNRFI